MRAQQSVRPLPEGLESPRAKLVYLYLESSDGATLAELQRALGLNHLSLYGILRTLRRRGFVDQDGDRYLPTRPA